MRENLQWGVASYDIIHEGKKVLERDKCACFSEFMGRFSKSYDTIRLRDIDCKKTFEYRSFYLQYVIDMFDLDGFFDDDGFEFKSLGIKKKDATVMTVVRFLWENLGGGNIDTPNLFFKRLRDDECPHEDKLERFCYFYKELADAKNKSYFSDGHSWRPDLTRIKNLNHFKTHTEWTSVNGFFTVI